MYNIRVGYGCGIKATLLTASGEVCDLRRARYKGALLVLPNGSTIPCADVSVDDVTNAIYVRLLADRELTTTGKYGISFNVKMANGVMYSSPVIMFAEVSDNAEVEYKELNISFAVTVTYLPANVAYTGASPKISPNGTWLVFNDEINAYEDTGEPASYAGLRGDIQDLKDDISNKTTPIFITENTAVDWKTIGKNSKGELCVIGGDSEVSDYLAGYLSVNGYVKDEDVAATYATRKWVESKKYITFEDVPLTLKAYVNDAGYITLEAIAPYAKKADTLGGYGITNAYTKSEVDSAIFGALLPEKIMPSILIDDITIKRKADGTLYAVGGAGGGGIAYPLTWSGYSSGVYDGSASANISIPSLLSQLQNDVEFITSASVNSLLTDYLPKSGGVVSGDITAPTFVGKLSSIGLLSDSIDRGTIAYSRFDYPENSCGLPINDNANGVLTINTHEGLYNHQLGFSTSGFFYRKMYDLGINTPGYWHAIIHTGNYSDYALPITGGTVNGNISANSLSVYGTSLLRYTAGDFPFKDVLNFTWSESTGDGIKLSVPGYHAEDMFLHLTVGGGAAFSHMVTASKFIGDLQGHADSATLWSYNSPWVQDFDALNYSNNGLYHFNGDYANLTGRPPHYSWNYSVLNMGSGSGRRQQVAIPYSTSRMFLRVNVDNNWSDWREFAFIDSDNFTPASGNMTVNGNVVAMGGVTAKNISDRRLKQNIRAFDAISILRGMGGVHAYEYVDTEVARDARYTGTHFGFIYQDVKGSELERMCLKREDGYGTLNYLDSNLISVVAGGVLSLDDRVRSLEHENEQLREEINRLNARLS